ncbi:MAG: aminopeptidase [Spirochaetota bacterium]
MRKRQKLSRHPVRGFFLLLLISLIVLFFYLFFDGLYLTNQAVNLFRLHRTTANIDKLILSDIDPSTKDFLLLTQDIKKFAIEQLGLKDTPNYNTFIDTERTYLVDVVSAVRSDSLLRYERTYPLVGKVFYKGFFQPEQAQRFAAHLQKRGYDVHVRKVSAYSSLGYLRDPLYSYMVHYDVHRLAELLIHEQVHSTIWIPGHNTFNEELATFIGREGASAYIRHTYGADSPLLAKLRDTQQDYATITALFSELHAELESQYSQTPDITSRLEIKTAMISAAKNHFIQNYDQLFLTPNYRGLQDIEWNHALIDVYVKYGGDLSDYYRLNELIGGDIRSTLEMMRSFKENPKTELRAVLRSLS